MLYLMSLGLGPKGVSLEGLEAGKACKRLYLEAHTLDTNKWKSQLEEIFGKEIHLLDRAGVEEGSSKLVQEARKQDVGLLVGGDALSATTHLSLVMDCKKAGVPFKVVHGSSILTAVGECGLSLYKFGEVVTVPRPQKGFRPTGFIETIQKNKSASLHSLLLLEIDMTVKEAVSLLLDIDKRVFQEKLVAISRLGSGEQVIQYGGIKELDGKAPAVLVLPGKLNAFEKEFLEDL